MAQVFAITAATNRVELDAMRQGEVVFTVSNAEKRPMLGRVSIPSERPSVSFEVPEPEKKQAFPWWILLVILAVVVVGGLALFLLDGGETAEPPAGNQNVVHSIGEVVTVGDSTMTLNNATVSNNNLVVSFTIANQGTADLPIRTRIDFGASAADGTNLQQDILRCIGDQLDTNIPPGSETTGAICYRATAAPPFTITFTSREAAGGTIVWRVE